MRRLAAAVLLCLLAGCAGAGKHPRVAPAASAPFLDEAARRGLDFVHRTGGKDALNIYQTSAGGCGLLDYDGDSFLDLYLVQGQHTGGPGGGNRLYRNRGDGTFEDVTEKAGVRGRGYGMACAAGDFDGDGRTDLYVCNYGRNELFRNRGDGTFEEVAARMHADLSGCSAGAVFADLDGDGWTDLYVVRYVKVAPTSPLVCRMNDVPTSCGPQQYAAQPGVFLRSLGGRNFRDETASRGLVNDGRGMAAAVAPWSNGSLALLVTNDTTANDLFVPGAGRFRNDALASGVAYGDLGHAEGNMGCDWGDYDGDGDLDLFIGAMQHRMNLLYRCDGPGAYTLATRGSGIAEPSTTVTTYGGGFVDFDQDGDLDLFQANGHVQNRIAEIEPGISFPQPCQLFENDGSGGFRDLTPTAGPALQHPAPGRGAAFGDIDNDGDVDILVNNLEGGPRLLINQAEGLRRHWLRVRLQDARGGTPEGALVRLSAGGKTRVRLSHAAYSYASTSDPRVHFGLGAETAVGPLTVVWPGGKEQQVPVPSVDTELVVKQAR